MSAAVNSRAAVSFGSPQDVEVLVEGAWVPGAMLGWRHDATGACEAWVRLRADVPGVVEGAGTWVGLVDVRLPERHLALAPAPAPEPVLDQGSGAPVGGRRASRASRRSRRHGGDVTAEQPAVGAAGAGRHRAPAEAVPGRHRALTTEMPAVVVDPAATSAETPAGIPVAAPAVAAPVGDATVVAPAVRLPAPEPDLLTRPIRLGDLVPNPRGGRPAVPTA
ncbi:hypothetical protein ACI78R_07930 [Geodermatophilus sp. SYSU D01106]